MDEKFVPRRILVIDDEEGFLALASLQFGKRGHKVMTALNCETGLNLIKTVPLDVVFLDLRMPGVDGIETLRRIRRIKKELPVIVVTAHTSDEMIQQAEDLGISAVFRKGTPLSDLEVVMEKALT
ncbi:MAG: response regulator [Candidatus Omnitrophota bacterium]|nr:response regulator [Candidatus Omnitrophota bacterium]